MVALSKLSARYCCLVFALGREEETLIATEDGLLLTSVVRGAAYTGMVIVLPSLSLHLL